MMNNSGRSSKPERSGGQANRLFNFLTWSFFLAPDNGQRRGSRGHAQIAAAEEECTESCQAGAAVQAANDDPQEGDPSKMRTVDENARDPPHSRGSEEAQLDPKGFWRSAGRRDHSEQAREKLSPPQWAAAVSGGAEVVAVMMPIPVPMTLTCNRRNSVTLCQRKIPLGSGQRLDGRTFESVPKVYVLATRSARRSWLRPRA